ncbi:MAG: hypothetical protein NC337_10765 [Roseburia sp.]|nr:hypothetical protein [Roseburia sp.]
MILRGDNAARREEVEKILDREFMLREHRTGLEAFMKGAPAGKLLVAFRAAGAFSLEKLAFGAAAKPHSILAKTIKPAEVGLAGKGFEELSLKGVPYDEKAGDNIARRFLCGLVGVRGDSEVTGLYLSSEGSARLSADADAASRVNKGAIRFPNTDMLTAWINALLRSEGVSEASKYFITGDYDIHEIQKKTGGEYAHIQAGSDEEEAVLSGLSKGALGGAEDREHSPIQHGAQDNYLDFMFSGEPHVALVPQVLLPDRNIAVYCGERDEWSIIRNSPAGAGESEAVREARALYTQVAEMKALYGEYGAAFREHWEIDEENVDVQEELMELYGETPEGCVSRLRAAKAYFETVRDETLSGGCASPEGLKGPCGQEDCANRNKCEQLKGYIQYYTRLVDKYGAKLGQTT